MVPGVDPTTTSSSTTTPQRRVLRCGATREYIRDPWARPPPEGDDDDEAAGGPELLEALKRKAEALHPGLFAAGREAYGVTAGTRVAAKRRWGEGLGFFVCFLLMMMVEGFLEGFF